MKKLLLSAFIAIAPVSAYAGNPELACANFGKLTGAVSFQRDAGISANEAYANMVSKGLNVKLAEMAIDIVYYQMPYESADTIAGITYVACMKVVKQ